MPRYFITTSDHLTVLDDEGTDVPNTRALCRLLRDTLAEILRDEGDRTGRDEFTAVANDADGRHVMTAKISFTISEP